MPEWLRYTLIASMFIVLFIGFGTWGFLRWKVSQDVKKFKELEKEFSVEKEILLDEKIQDNIKTNSWVVEDFEFILNTINKNNYKNNLFIEENPLAFGVSDFHFSNLNNKLIAIKNNIEIFTDLYKNTDFPFDSQKITSDFSTQKWNFIFCDKHTNTQEIKEYFSSLETSGMLMIRNNFHKKDKKEIQDWLKQNNIKYHFQKLSDTFLLIVA
ncbi:BC85_0335 family putative methyltransferase [Mycoplasma procyoni]|uniref:BC85_0335 family putative methyltransferase n=1 Tax=Mycoplasma procyoni TaxID=568784 RepID=UPI00197C23C6|nr:hypothetical protein [Mycoplasma procyoni]MBN3534411.1 hypothetical protein [Mycoplasma procyoni]